MRYLLLLLLSSPVMAQDYSVDWGIEGLSVGGVENTEIRLDLRLGARFFAANGVIVYGGVAGAPATGTCFLQSTGDVFCNLQVDQYTYNMEIDDTLNGVIEVRDSIGATIDSGTVTYSP